MLLVGVSHLAGAAALLVVVVALVVVADTGELVLGVLVVGLLSAGLGSEVSDALRELLGNLRRHGVILPD